MATVKEPFLGVSPLQVTPYVMSILKHRGGEEGNRKPQIPAVEGVRGGRVTVASQVLEGLGSWNLCLHPGYSGSKEGLVIGSVQRPASLCISFCYHHPQSWQKNAPSALSFCAFFVGQHD